MSLNDFGWNPFFSDQLTTEERQSDIPGRIVSLHRNKVIVTDGLREHTLTIAGSWYRRPTQERPTVGDFVLLDTVRGRITRLLERHSVFQRPSIQDKSNIQLLASNIDRLFVMTSCNAEFSESRLERYLVLASDAGVDPIIVLTKVDLVENASDYYERARRIAPSYRVVQVNCLAKETLTTLSACINYGTTVALVGSSGVGKSTLLNTLSGDSVQTTGRIRERDMSGRHTTTARYLHLLQGGGLVLDAPGMRELGMSDTGEGISKAFNEIEALSSACKFNDCSHIKEPGCAVKQALKDGRLDSRRYQNYQKLVQETLDHSRP